MTSFPNGVIANRTSVGVLYLAAAVVLLDQTAILAASVYPVAAGSVNWRFGAVGLAAGRATPFLLADLLLLAAGMLAGHRVFLRVLAGFHILVAVLLAGTLGLFVLDTMEIRVLLPLDARRQAIASATRAFIALLVMAIYCLVVAIRVIRATPRATARSADRLIVFEGHTGTAK